MRKLFLLMACLALSGCASVLKDLQGCERHYDGTVAGGSMTPAVMAGAARIDCCPVGVPSADHTHCIPLPVADVPPAG